MRSVKVERKPRSQAARSQTVRCARGRRELPAVQPGSARRQQGPGALSRLAGRLAIFARRPMLALCGPAADRWCCWARCLPAA